MLQQRAVGTFSNYTATEGALNDLKESGFVMDQVSVVGRDMERHPENSGANTTSRLEDVGNTHPHDNQAEEGAKKGAVTGGTIGGVTGLLVGLGALAIPGVGPVMMAGAAATAIATALSGGAIGAAAGGLAGGLVGLGIPEDRAKAYGDRVGQGDYLFMIDGSAADIARAEAIAKRRGITEWYVYDVPTSSMPSATTAPMLDNHPRM